MPKGTSKGEENQRVERTTFGGDAMAGGFVWRSWR